MARSELSRRCLQPGAPPRRHTGAAAARARRLVLAAAALALTALSACVPARPGFILDHDAVIRGDTGRRDLALVFTGGDFADGGLHIARVLAEQGVKAGFFFTGDFYRDPARAELIRGLAGGGHYLGPHSSRHLLYAPWEKRDSSLVSREEFSADLRENLAAMQPFALPAYELNCFIPPYEWYNARHVAWAAEMGMTLFNFTPGTSVNADYTTPEMPGYRSSMTIWEKIFAREREDPYGLNGFILLIHIGTDPRRSDKFYLHLGALIDALRGKGYTFVRIDQLLEHANRKRSQ
ncbi:MAG TPA: polysaccharide deacetylase family protein [bacterium]|nr:polysaccharide deacetylase family protein [bacterium]HOZ21028.1 polysaccharide deacetylase family protein [bacterium]